MPFNVIPKSKRSPTIAIPGSKGNTRPTAQKGGGGNKAAGSPQPTVASSTVETVSPTGTITPGAAATPSDLRRIAAERRQARAATAALKQKKVVERFVTRTYSKKLKSEGVKNVSDRVAKAKSQLAAERTKLLTHPEVQKANKEGKVVGSPALREIRQRNAALNKLLAPGSLQTPVKEGPGF